MAKNVYQERIRQALKETGLSFKAAALSAGIPEHTLRKWVQGIATPKLDQFALLLRVGINPLYILTGEGPPVIEKAKGVDVTTLAAQALSQSKKKLQMRKNFSDAPTRPSSLYLKWVQLLTSSSLKSTPPK